MRRIIATAFLLGVGISTAAAQTITGRVVEVDTNTPIRAAEVMIIQVDSSYRTVSDEKGAFRLPAAIGMWTLRVQALGYEPLTTQPMTIDKKEHLSVVVVMSMQPIDIAPITVIARSNRILSKLDEFYERKKKSGFGYFLDQKQIERMNGHEVSDLLRMVPGAWVERNSVRMRGCGDAHYVVDGMPIYPIGGETATEAVNAMVSPTDIAGIEVYRNEATAPMELTVNLWRNMGQSSCGIIAIWTKR